MSEPVVTAEAFADKTGRPLELVRSYLEHWADAGIVEHNGDGYKLTPRGWTLVHALNAGAPEEPS